MGWLTLYLILVDFLALKVDSFTKDLILRAVSSRLNLLDQV